MEPLSQVTFQSIFDLAVPARESSEFVGGKRSGPKAVILTAERDESGSSKGSLHGCVCEINLRGQLELGGEDRWRMWSSVFSAGRDGVWRCAKSAWRNSWQSDNQGGGEEHTCVCVRFQKSESQKILSRHMTYSTQNEEKKSSLARFGVVVEPRRTHLTCMIGSICRIESINTPQKRRRRPSLGSISPQQAKADRRSKKI